MAAPIALRESNIKVYASVLMDNSVSLEEKAVALCNFFIITNSNTNIYNTFGLGVYFRDEDSGDIKTTHVPVVSPS